MISPRVTSYKSHSSFCFALLGEFNWAKVIFLIVNYVTIW